MFAELLTLLRRLYISTLVGILLVGACTGISYGLRELRPEPLWTNATKVLSERINADVAKSLNIVFSRGEFINIDGQGGIVIGTIADSVARHHLLSTQPFRQCEYGCTGWLSISRVGRSLPLNEEEHMPDRARVILDAAMTQESRCAARFHYLGQTLLPGDRSSPDLDIICLSERTGTFVYEFRTA